MKQQSPSHRRVAALLFAAAALPFTPSLAQETATPPPVAVTPPPVVVTPPAPVSTAPPVVAPTPPRATPAEQPAAQRTTTRRTTRTTTTRTTSAAATRSAPARAAAPAPAARSPAEAAAPAEVPPSTTATPVPVTGSGEVPNQAVTAESANPTWMWVAAGLGIVAALAALMLLLRRRRRADEDVDYYYEEPVAVAPVTPAIEPQPYVAPYVAPAMVATPAAAEPVAMDRAEADVRRAIASDATPAVETLAVGVPAREDVDAMAAASEPRGNRPWLEMLMRPLRAGTTSDDARVEFELTVGNTGSVSAEDVRISTWMFPAGAERATEMERLLIDSEESIEPGDGTRVEAAIALPKAALHESVLPVVVADARYRLPDGSEGRTQAAFAVGLPQDGELAPFPVDRSSGLLETVEARLHGDLKRD